MTLKIPKLWNFFQLERDDPKALHDLDVSLDHVYQELYKELEILDSQQATNIADIATNVADIATNVTGIATNVTNIATNVTNIGTNVTDITALEARLDIFNAKMFNGTTDSDSQTAFAHGLTSSKICGFSAAIQRSDGVIIGIAVGDSMFAAVDSFRYYCNATNFYLDTVGTSLQGRPYRVVIFYVD